MKPLIKHQMQPCPVSCVSTSLAMLIDRPASELIDRFHKRYREECMSMREMLNELGVPFTSFDSCDRPLMEYCGAYLVTVPSINIEGGTHQIVIELTEDELFLHDPNKGREGCRVYVKRGETADGCVELNSFFLDAFICRSWLEARA